MQRERKKLNQAGFSLVELIVVVLILGILSAGSVVGINFANNMNANGAAVTFASVLERARMQTISADGDVSVKLIQDGNKYFALILEDGAETERVKIGTQALTIKAYKGATGTTVGSSGCEFEFEKADGSFDSDYTSVEFIGRRTEVVKLVRLTGRSYLE
ncbi:MAG: type II secretion system protein [Lachnospiraceae bacterium]|nr:type II secretion system protein [Lachnospiraceae bacterium]